MRKVVLISCSKSKRNYSCEVRKLYDPSPLFRKSLTYAEKISSDIHIISAKYGLLRLDQVIEPYDLSLNDMTTDESKAWGEFVIKQIRSQYDVENTEFIILAGAKYYLPLMDHISKRNIRLPLKGMSMGDRLNRLDQLIASSNQDQTMCYRLHKLFNEMPRNNWMTIDDVPFDSGIYIVFQEGEKHHNFDRVVRVGTHRSDGRLKGRLKDHFLRENKDGSIFRKNIGRALLNLNNHPYLQVWNRDTSKASVIEQMSSTYDPSFQEEVEKRVSTFLRERFSFVCFPVVGISERLRLEEGIIATLNSTPDFGPSLEWSGMHSPEMEIRQSGMWLKEGLDGTHLSESEFSRIESYCSEVKLMSPKRKPLESYRPKNVYATKKATTEGNAKAEILWQKITESLSQAPYDLQTIMLSGRKNKWFTANAFDNNIIVSQCLNHTPSMNIKFPRIIEKDEFVTLYPNYYKWRSGRMTRAEADGNSHHSSYIFALINEFETPEVEIHQDDMWPKEGLDGTPIAEALWQKITNSLSQAPYDLQTIMLSGRKNKWFTANAFDNSIIISQCLNRTPSMKIKFPRIVNKGEFVTLYPNYYKWRNGSITRAEANEYSHHSSFIFALINEFETPEVEIHQNDMQPK
ncbi:MAG: hypothetical protein GX763_06880, partial [Clostridiaceae bacterium]|nr:hypothetical protein [Clostridiaceae bacterium]